MDNNKNSSTFLILGGLFILGIFTYVSAINILPNNSSDSFFSKDEDESDTIITDISLENDKIVVTTNNIDASICIKQTKSEPSISSICWKDTKNNKVAISVYEGKTYYIWLKDNNENISNYVEYNTNTGKVIE